MESGDRRLVEGAISTMALLEVTCGSVELGRWWAEECIASCRASGNLRTLAYALSRLSEAEYHTGNFDRAVELLEEALGYHRKLGDVRGTANALSNLGVCLLGQSQLGAARPYLEEALTAQRAQGMRHWYSLTLLASLLLAQGDPEGARRLVDDAAHDLAVRGSPDLIELGYTTQVRGDVARAQGRLAEALALHREALAVASRSGNRPSILDCIEAIAASLADHGDPEEAVVMWAAAKHGRSGTGIQITPFEKTLRDQHIEALRASLTGNRFDEAWAEGQALTIEEATNRGLEVSGRPSNPGAIAGRSS